MEGEMIEEMAKKDVSLRWYEVSEEDALTDEDYCLEVSTAEDTDLEFVKKLKRRLPLEYRDVIFSSYGDELILQFIGVEENGD